MKKIALLLALMFIIGGWANASGIQNSHERHPYRMSNGSNYWGDSNFRSWLNSDKGAGEVIWLDNNPPDYENDAGFLNGFTLQEKNAIKKAKRRYRLENYDKDVPGAYDFNGEFYEDLVDKVFLLDDKTALAMNEEFKIGRLTKFWQRLMGKYAHGFSIPVFHKEAQAE